MCLIHFHDERVLFLKFATREDGGVARVIMYTILTISDFGKTDYSLKFLGIKGNESLISLVNCIPVVEIGFHCHQALTWIAMKMRLSFFILSIRSFPRVVKEVFYLGRTVSFSMNRFNI
jgi:hypothetical protein